MSTKKCIKVCFQGETKRLRMTSHYEALALQTREAFGNGLERVWPIKFYYLDEENELISINSQSDFQEALSIEDFSMLKLTVAANVTEARKQLEQSISDSISIGQSINNFKQVAPRMRGQSINSDTISIIRNNNDDSPFE
jgi:hypothetical protein